MCNKNNSIGSLFNHTKKMTYTKRALRIIPAIILLQTLFFKFTAHPESVALFTKLWMEPYGRIGIWILELIAWIMIMIPLASLYGSLLIIWLMFWAIYFHITILWYDQLFVLAVVALCCCIVNVRHDKQQIITLYTNLFDE